MNSQLAGHFVIYRCHEWSQTWHIVCFSAT